MFTICSLIILKEIPMYLHLCSYTGESCTFGTGSYLHHTCRTKQTGRPCMILLDDRMGLTSNREVLIHSLNAPFAEKDAKADKWKSMQHVFRSGAKGGKATNFVRCRQKWRRHF